MESWISLVVSLLALAVLLRLMVAIAGLCGATGSDEQQHAAAEGASNAEVGSLYEQGFPGRWNSPLERDRYHGNRGYDA